MLSSEAIEVIEYLRNNLKIEINSVMRGSADLYFDTQRIETTVKVLLDDEVISESVSDVYL